MHVNLRTKLSSGGASNKAEARVRKQRRNDSSLSVLMVYVPLCEIVPNREASRDGLDPVINNPANSAGPRINDRNKKLPGHFSGRGRAVSNSMIKYGSQITVTEREEG
jgi:hypothetical protein